MFDILLWLHKHKNIGNSFLWYLPFHWLKLHQWGIKLKLKFCAISATHFDIPCKSGLEFLELSQVTVLLHAMLSEKSISSCRLEIFIQSQAYLWASSVTLIGCRSTILSNIFFGKCHISYHLIVILVAQLPLLPNYLSYSLLSFSLNFAHFSQTGHDLEIGNMILYSTKQCMP